MTHTDGLKNVEQIINQFGGMRPMARKVEVAVSTIQGWKKRDHIPSDRVAEVMSAARKYDVQLDDASNENTAPAAPKPTVKTETKTVSSAAITPPTQETSPVKPARQKSSTDTSFIDPAQIRRDATRRSAITTVSIIAILGGIGFLLFGNEAKEVVEVAQDQKQIEARVDNLSSQFTSFENTVTEGLNSLSDRATDIAAAVGVERGSNGQLILNNNLSVTERLTALESRLRASGEEIDLGQLVNRFEALNETTQGQNEMNLALSDLKGIVTILQGRMGELDGALEQAKQDNDALARSLENVDGRDLSAAAMLLALTQFRDSVNREQPFTEDLEVLQGLVGEEDPELTEAITRLSPHAQSGVLTPEGLSHELRTVTGEIVMAKLQGEDVSIQDKILGRLGQILSVEKDGQPLIATQEQKIIAEAQKHLDDGNVQAAVATLNQLDGEAAKAAQPFTQKALGTLTAQGTTEMLIQKFMQKLQEPEGLKNMIQDTTSGTVIQDDASGIVILE